MDTFFGYSILRIDELLTISPSYNEKRRQDFLSAAFCFIARTTGCDAPFPLSSTVPGDPFLPRPDFSRRPFFYPESDNHASFPVSESKLIPD